MPSNANAESGTNHVSSMDMQVTDMQVVVDMQGSEEGSNLSLAPEEIASLASLMRRYDQVLGEVDALNIRLQELLELEAPAKPNNLELASGLLH